LEGLMIAQLFSGHPVRLNRIVAAASIPAAGLAFSLLAPSAAPASAAVAASRLPCNAHMSKSHPADYTTTTVVVKTTDYAKVTTVAHYKTVNRKHHATANRYGTARVPYYISGATPGYKVKVSVTVRKGDREGSCSTSFTPHR
jgi:hypothetical protein